jgi:hypothetical protein
MTRKRRDGAVQGAVRCNPGEKNTPDNIRLMVKILILSHPSWLCERRAVAAAEAAIFREAIEALDDYDEIALSLVLGQDYRLLRFVCWWRLLPYGFWIERDGAYVLFDRDYCPIVRIRRYGHPKIVPPFERIDKIATRWFYDDVTAPYLDPQTAPTIVLLAADCGLEREIEYRWSLTDRGRAPYKTLAKRWKPR